MTYRRANYGHYNQIQPQSHETGILNAYTLVMVLQASQ